MKSTPYCLIFGLLLGINPGISSSAEVESPEGQDMAEIQPAAMAAVVASGPNPETAVGKNLVTGAVFEGDVIVVLQSLVDQLAPENGGTGGSVVLQNGEYVTVREHPLELRSGVHVKAATRHGAVLKLAAGVAETRPGMFFQGKRITDVVIDGLVFDGNRDEQNIVAPLTRDARAGERVLYVGERDAVRLTAQGRRIGIGRNPTKGPSRICGFLVRSEKGQEKARADSVDASTGAVMLKDPLQHDYSADAGAEVVHYSPVGGVGLSGSYFAIRNCHCVNTQEQPVLFVWGGEDDRGSKILEGNSVVGHRGGACIRLQRGTYGGVIRGNYVEDFAGGLQRFWGEGVAIEGNHHSIVQGNTIRGPGDRFIRANDAHHCVVANNVIWTPLVLLHECKAVSGFKPLRGDESLSMDTEGKPPVLVTGGAADQPGVVLADLGEAGADWHRYNRLHVRAKLQESEVDLLLTVEDAAGHWQTFRTITWVGDEWQWTAFDLTQPESSEGELDWAQIAQVHLACDTPQDGFRFWLGKLQLGRKTGWGVTVWGAEETTVANNTFYGVGAHQGTIYYGSGGWSASHELTISGNTLSFCYDGIGWDQDAASRITVSNNTLYATMGGIRGDVSAVGNVITFDPTNAATEYSLRAAIAANNRLYKTRGIAARGPEICNIRGNTLTDFHGPGITSKDNRGALVTANVLQTRLPDSGPAIRLDETASGNKISDNWIEGGGVALEIRGSHSAATGNFIRTTADNPIRDAGKDNAVRDNHLVPAAAPEVAEGKEQ